MRAIVIGAGPSGLAAAACLKKAGFTPEILDAGKKIEASPKTTRMNSTFCNAC